MVVSAVGIEREGVDKGTLNYRHCGKWKGFCYHHYRITIVHQRPGVPSQAPLSIDRTDEKQCHEKLRTFQ